MATSKENFIIENWIAQAVPALREQAGGGSLNTNQVMDALMKVWGRVVEFQNQVELFPYADQIKDELGKHNFTCRAGKWTFAQPAKKSKPAAG